MAGSQLNRSSYRGIKEIAMKKSNLMIALLSLTPGLASADISLSYPQQTACKTMVSSIQISGSHMRLDSNMENGNYSMLFDGLEDIITSLDHQGKSFHQIEVDEDALDYNKDVMSSTGNYIGNQMKAVQDQMKQQCAQMGKQGFSCANLPDLSSMMQSAQAMAGQQMPTVEIKQSDKNQAVAGVACQTYDRIENGSRISEACYVEPKDFPMSEKDKKYFLRNLKVMLHYTQSMSGLTDKLGVKKGNTPVQADPANKDILLSQVCFTPDGSEAARIEVQINSAAINQDLFEIPSGYRVMNMQEQQQ